MRRLAPALACLVLAIAALLAAPATAAAADWCGTIASADRPTVFAGAQVRVTYAIPVDGADAGSLAAPRISRAIDVIEDWWRRQDGERAPRFDRAAFACGQQVDLQLVRLTRTAEQLRAEAGRADAVRSAVQGASSSSLTQLVFYEGPVESDNLCGQGGGNGTQPGFAVVYLGACLDVPIEVVATHELLHSLGALPDAGPPHPCPGDDGHPCDSTGDVLFARASSAQLEVLALDFGRDDYYAHPGTWLDVQDSRWLKLVDLQVTLTLGIAGSGRVTDGAAGVECGADTCVAQWNAGAIPVLLAEPGAGQRLLRWTGACAGQRETCTVTLASTATTSAEFVAATFRLMLRVTGRGAITAGATRCAQACSRSVASFTATRLIARPTAGWRFVRWRGGCVGTRPTCTAQLRGDARVEAVFARR